MVNKSTSTSQALPSTSDRLAANAGDGLPSGQKYGSGSTAASFTRTSKWQCGPVVLPVIPTMPTTCPAFTTSPLLTLN